MITQIIIVNLFFLVKFLELKYPLYNKITLYNSFDFGLNICLLKIKTMFLWINISYFLMMLTSFFYVMDL